MEFHQISERQAVIPGSASQSEKDKSLGDMFSDLLQKITGPGAASAAASHAIGLENLPSLHVAPLKEREEHAAEEHSEELVAEDAQTEAAAKEQPKDTAEEAVAVISAVAKEITAKKEPVEQAVEASAAVEAQVVEGDAAATPEKFQMAQGQKAVVDQARAQGQMDSEQAPAMTQAAGQGVLSEEVELPQAALGRAKAERVSPLAGGATPAVTAGAATEEFTMVPAQNTASPKAEYSASPAAEYTRLQMILSNGAGGMHADASRSSLGADSAAKVMTALSGTGDSVLQGADRTKMVTRLAPAQQVRTIARIQQILDQVIRSRDLNTIVVKLDPQDLGQLTVKLTQRGDELFARIKPENPEVENLLKQKLPEITGVLAQAGLKLDNVHVSIGAEPSEAETRGFQNLLGRNSAQGESNNSGHDSGKGRDMLPRAAVEVSQPQNGYAEMDTAWIA